MLATTPAVASQPEEAIHETKETDDEVNLTQSSVTAKNVARIVGGDHPSMYDRFSLTGTAGLTTPADQFTLYLTLGASAGGINGEDHHLKIPQNPGRYVGPITGVEFHFQGPLGTKQETSYFRFGTHWSAEFWNIGESTATKRNTTKIYLTGTPSLTVANNTALGPRMYGAISVDEWGTKETSLEFDGSLSAFIGNRARNGWIGIRYREALEHEQFEGYHSEARNIGPTVSINLPLPKHFELYLHGTALLGIPNEDERENEYMLQVALGNHHFDVGAEVEVIQLVAGEESTVAGVVGIDFQIKFDGPTYRR